MNRRSFIRNAVSSIGVVLVGRFGFPVKAGAAPWQELGEMGNDGAGRVMKPIKLYSHAGQDVNVLCVEKLIAGLKARYEIKDIDYLVIKDDISLIMHVAFADPSEIGLPAGSPVLDDRGYTPIKLVDTYPFYRTGGWLELHLNAEVDCTDYTRIDGAPYICDLSDEVPTDIYNQGRLMNGLGRAEHYDQLRAWNLRRLENSVI